MGLETEMGKQIILVGSYTNFRIFYLIVPPNSHKATWKTAISSENALCARDAGACVCEKQSRQFLEKQFP